MGCVYDGGGAIVASLGLEGQAPRHEGHGNGTMLRARVTALMDDLENGYMSPAEFGKLCEREATRYAGWWER